MMPFIQEEAVAKWGFTAEEIINFIAISESTPGPFAVNIATFVGASQGGVLGALMATLGIILPSFVIIIVIAALIGNLMKYAGVQSVVNGMKPAVTGIILATALSMLVKAILAVEQFGQAVSISYSAIIIFSLTVVIDMGYKKFAKKTASAILLIVFSAVMGMLICPFIP